MEKITLELTSEEVKIILSALNRVSVQGLGVMEKFISVANKISKAVKKDGSSIG